MNMTASQILSSLRAEPLTLCVSFREDKAFSALKESHAALSDEARDLRFRVQCLSTLLSRIRDYCRDNGITLPSGLSEVTPWEL